MKREVIWALPFVLVLALAGSASAQPSTIPGWWTEDIGDTDPGNASESGGTFTITGDGADIWGTADAFYYVYKQLTGDGMITARVVSHGSGSNTWAKGGVMIRDNNTAGSADVYAVITDNQDGAAANGAGVQWRDSQGGSAAWSGSGAAAAVDPPHWVRLVREGDTFTGYHSADGDTWTELPDPHTVAMEDPVLIGLCVTSHAAGELRTYQFDNVTMSGNITDKQPQLKAWDPSPPDGFMGVDTPLFQWQAGETAIAHLVYFGTDPENLTFMGEMGWMVYWHGAGLIEGATHYWRVDEKEADGTVHEGDLWSFVATPLLAWNPSPADGATDVMITEQLSWNAGKTITTAVKHHLFFGTDQTAVANGTGDADKGILDDTAYDPGLLLAESTYYVKVNEVEADGSEREGDLWSFETVPAGPGKIMREWWFDIGSGNAVTDLTGNARYPDDPTGWEWIDLFEGPSGIADNYGSRLSGWLFPPATGDYTFWIASDNGSQLRLSTDEDPANAVMVCEVPGTSWTGARSWAEYPEQKSTPVTLDAGQRYYIEALMKEGGGGDHVAVAWQGPGVPVMAVISAEYVGPTPYLPEKAYSPSPADGATGVPDTVVISWQAGVKAIQHDMYFGTDADAVAAAGTTTAGIYRSRLGSASYTPTESPLEWGVTYYVRVDEVNNDATVSIGRVWSFTVADYIVVDDFEDYNDYSPHRIFQTWLDGYGYTDPPPGKTGNGTGSTVGHLTYPYAEQGTVHGGMQSMPFGYDNTGAGGKARYSEAEREYAVAQNFSRKGVKSMSLWVYGDPCNVPATVYVGLQDSTGTRVDVPDTDTDIVMRGRWQEINIELSKFSPVNLGSIRKIYLGVGNRLSPMPGPTGSLFIDDVRLYGPRCIPSKLKPAASLNDDCIVDYLDVEILSDDWLMSDVTEPAWDAPFTNGDVGVPLAGSYSFDGTTYTITGNGHDIWDEADDFHYAYHQISGDVQMTVRVKSMTQVHSWAKAGIMIRDTLDAGSANAMVALTGGDGNGGTFQWRTDPDVASGSSRTLTGITVPTCVRLVREGDTFTGYIFLDGRWQQEGTSVDVVMTDPVYIGLAVTSHTDGVLETATFDRECTFSAAELNADGVIDFKDFAVMADAWLDELLWPAEP